MGWFDSYIRKHVAQPILDEAKRINGETGVSAPQFIPMMAAAFGSWSFDGFRGYRKAMRDCSPLASIIISYAKAFSNGETLVLNPNNDNTVTGVKKDWVKLFNQPNRFTSGLQFQQRMCIEVLTFGFCYILPMYAAGFSDIPYSLYILPTEFIEIELVYPDRALWEYGTSEPVRKIFFNFGGRRTEIDESKLVRIDDTTPTVNQYTLLPQSRLINLHYPISIFVSAEEAILTLEQNRGALGVLTPTGKDVAGMVPLLNEDKEQLQADFQRYGLTRNQWQIIISNQAVDWVQIGMNISELRLDENKLNATRSIAFQFGYPEELTPWATNSTRDNVKYAERRFYQNEIIPFANSVVSQLSQGLKMSETRSVLKISYDNVAIFQQSLEEKGKGREAMGKAVLQEYKNNLITWNRALELLGEDQKEGTGDYYYYQSPEYMEQVAQTDKRLSNAQQNKGATA